MGGGRQRTGTGSLGANCSQVTWKKGPSDSRTLGDHHRKEKRKMQNTESLLGTDWLMPSALCHQISNWRQGVGSWHKLWTQLWEGSTRQDGSAPPLKGSPSRPPPPPPPWKAPAFWPVARALASIQHRILPSTEALSPPGPK